MKRRRRVTRWVIAAALLLIGGAIINVLLAWSVSVLLNPARVEPVGVNERNHKGELFVFRWDRPGHIVSEGVIAHREGIADGRTTLGAENSNEIWPTWDGWLERCRALERYPNVNIYTIHGSGWPLTALFWSKENSPGARDVIRCGWPTPLDAWDDAGGRMFDRVIPYGIVWPNFAINTLLYTATLWMLFAVPFALRRWRRRMRGLCPACAYPIGTSPVCTECGRAVTRLIE